jgi:DNA-directed RNA polymerase subunit N (RpoN/RPB10)
MEQRRLFSSVEDRLLRHLYPSLGGSVQDTLGAVQRVQFEERVWASRGPLPPCCISCGRQFSQIWERFLQLRALSGAPSSDNLYTRVFDECRVSDVCCRVNIMGTSIECPSEILRAWVQDPLSSANSLDCAPIAST